MESQGLIKLAGYSPRGSALSLLLFMLLGLPVIGLMAIHAHGGPLSAPELPRWGLGAGIVVVALAVIHQAWVRSPQLGGGAVTVWIERDRLNSRAPWPSSVRLADITDVTIADAPTSTFKTNQTLTIAQRNGPSIQLQSIYLDRPLSHLRSRILEAARRP